MQNSTLSDQKCNNNNNTPINNNLIENSIMSLTSEEWQCSSNAKNSMDNISVMNVSSQDNSDDDVLLNDQNTRLTIRVIADGLPKQPYAKTSGTQAPKRYLSHSPQTPRPSLTIVPKSRSNCSNTVPKHNYMSVVDYQTTTTTTTTTRTKLSSPKPQQLKAFTENINKTKHTGGEINCGKKLRRENRIESSRNSLTSNAHNAYMISDEEDAKHSSSKPLLVVLEHYNHEKVTKTTKSNLPHVSSLTLHRSADDNTSLPESSRPSMLESQHLRSEDGERETWANKTDFLLSVIGFAVDLANVWRFPYLCFKNGGGAFLIPYIIMVAFAGIPLFYMELALGQYHRKGAITTWGKICPLFKGIGYCVIMTAFYTDFFYNVIIAFALHYFFASFTTKLPWTSCSNSYNSPACYEPSWSSGESQKCATTPVFVNSSSLNSSHRAVSAAEEYFYKYFLGLHEERSPIAHVVKSVYNLGDVNWEMVACVLIVYLICYFSLWKGIKTSGKVVWFTAIFPYVVLAILLVRGLTLPGWQKGIEYYLKPNLEMLKMPSVWQDAATQVFFSLGPGFGVLLAYSSYNDFHNNVYSDALIASSINCATSFMAGFVIFAILGYMSCKSGKPIHEVAQEGPGLAFVVYPEVLSTMPGSWIWSIAFFLMLLTLGLDSSFGGSEAIITGLSDEYPILGRNREAFVALLFIFYMIIGIFMCTQGGMLVMEWLIFYGTAWGLLIAVFCETMVISFCYGIKQFSNDIREMLGFAPGWYWKICWTIGAPTFLIAMILSSFINYQPLQYQDYVYPFSANVLGLIFALSSASAIPIVGIYTWYHQPGNGCWHKLQMSLQPVKRKKILSEQPSEDWSANAANNELYEAHPHSNDVML